MWLWLFRHWTQEASIRGECVAVTSYLYLICVWLHVRGGYPHDEYSGMRMQSWPLIPTSPLPFGLSKVQ